MLSQIYFWLASPFLKGVGQTIQSGTEDETLTDLKIGYLAFEFDNMSQIMK
jgi:hypothetical protein